MHFFKSISLSNVERRALRLFISYPAEEGQKKEKKEKKKNERNEKEENQEEMKK